MTTEPQLLMPWASAYVQAGFSLIPIQPDGSKRPARGYLPVTVDVDGNPKRGWMPFKQRLPTEDELTSWFLGWRPRPGMAVVCGEVSGNLEAIDIDSWPHAEPWLARLRETAPELLERLVLVRTPRPGLHCYYRCATIQGSTHLAKDQLVDETGTPHLKTTIETRGEGAYIIIPPTPGYCHRSGREYVYHSQRTLIDVQQITPAEREFLWHLSRSFHNVPTPQRPPSRPRQASQPSGHGRPGDVFNARGDWTELLERHGWRLHHSEDETQYWTRPGKADGVSASLNHDGNDKLYVFSSNAPPLEPEKGYSKFRVFTLMEHDGDFTAAAAALRLQGYGVALPLGRRQRAHSTRRRQRRRNTRGRSRRRS